MWYLKSLLILAFITGLSADHSHPIHQHDPSLEAHEPATWTYPTEVSGYRGQVRGTLYQKQGGWEPCDPTATQHSGYFTVDANTHKNYFYWAFGPRNGQPAEGAPVILWLTGGPGCSGSIAVLKENGPCTIKDDGTLASNPYSWNTAATVIYVDQPAGVGFSYSDRKGHDSNEAEVSEDLYFFLQALLKSRPELQRSPLFVIGESYGGHYAPATAHRILVGNQKKEGVPILLQGMAMGNGLTVPSIQYQYYAELAYPYCKAQLGHPCVDYANYQAMNASIPSCVSLCDRCDGGSTWSCRLGQYYCNSQELTPYMKSGRNPYDIRLECKTGNLCYDFSSVSKFLNRHEVKAALGAKPSITWKSCNMEVNLAFSADWLHRFDTMLPDLLHAGIRVLVYAGDMDFICNWLGNKAWTLAMEWRQKEAFQQAHDVPWIDKEQKVRGWVRSVHGAGSPILFTFLRVANAGHMVPMDQPAAALAMVQQFLNNKAFE